MNNYKNLEGSGGRALEGNDQALAEAEAALEAIQRRVQNGEQVDTSERLAAITRRDRLKEDRARIESAGI